MDWSRFSNPRKPSRNSRKSFEDDPETFIVKEMAKELGVAAKNLKIDSGGRGLSSFGAGDAWLVEVKGDRREWVVVHDEDVAREIALAVVKQDLEEEPGIFNQGFIESHINVDRLRRDLHSDTHSANYDRLSEDVERDSSDFWREAEQHGMDTPEEDEDGDRRAPTDGEVDELADKITDEELRDPVEYLTDMLGQEDGLKEAIRIGGIDEDAAAEDAVNVDGWQHFLAQYDGTSHETSGGLVYWRAN